MNLSGKLDELAAMNAESDNDETRRRMRAALRIGARVALEHVVLSSTYPSQSDIDKALADLDGTPAPVPSAAPAAPALPEQEL